MLYNDDAIPTNESIKNMVQSYAKIDKATTLSVGNNDKQPINSNVFNLYNQEVELLKNLSNYAQNVNIKQYLQGLAIKSENELKKLVEQYPYIDTSLEDNPVFYNRFNSNLNFKKFLDGDLQIIDILTDGMQNLNKEDERAVLFKFVNRHIQALRELFSLMHLLTFY